MKALDQEIKIRDARPEEADDLLPLLRSYCEFYEAEANEPGLMDLVRTLATDPEQGSIFIARNSQGRAVGVATLCWKWSSLRGARIGVLEDLFVHPDARGSGLADALIATCAARCRERGMAVLCWFTGTDNHRAQAVYDRVGGTSEALFEYTLEL